MATRWRKRRLRGGNPGQAPPPKLTKRAKRVELLDIALLCAVPMVTVFAGTLVARLGYRKKEGAPWKFTAHYLSYTLEGFAVGAAVIVVFLLWRRHHWLCGHEDDLLRPWRGDSRLRLWLTFASFMAGVVVGAGLRFYLGPLTLTGFFQGTTPVMAGLLVGIVFSTTNISEVDRAAYRQRQLGVIYVLIGALAGAGGSTPGAGWLYGACFLIIWGSLAASSYVVMNLIFGKDG